MVVLSEQLHLYQKDPLSLSTEQALEQELAGPSVDGILQGQWQLGEFA